MSGGEAEHDGGRQWGLIVATSLGFAVVQLT
jgi:hypothetical protein